MPYPGEFSGFADAALPLHQREDILKPRTIDRRKQHGYTPLFHTTPDTAAIAPVLGDRPGPDPAEVQP